MRSNRTRAALAALAALCAALTLSTTACGQKNELSRDYDYQIDMSEYESAVLSVDKTHLTLANKQHPLGETYAPAALATVPAELTLYGKEIQLETTVATAAEALVRELHELGYTDIMVTSGYRSYEYQSILFNTYLGQEMEKHPDWTQAQCEAEVLTYSAKPGESEHQTGLCLDLISTGNVVLDESFAQNPAYAYLIENAHNFGFILRYPEGKEETTGYAYEPWHYRFVGVKAATEIHEGGITLEEYLG